MFEMLQLVDSDEPYRHTFHRAWTACVGRPAYDKAARERLEATATRAEDLRDRDEIDLLMQGIERLLAEQGGVYRPTTESTKEGGER